MKIKELKPAQVVLEDSGTVRVTLKDEFNVSLEEAQELSSVFGEFCQSEKRNFLIDARNSFAKIPEEVKFIATNDPNQTTTRNATAILINTLANKVLTDFYIRVFKPSVPTKVFNDEEKALKWLDTVSQNSTTFIVEKAKVYLPQT